MVQIIRERWLISHKSYFERDIEIEITLVNNLDNDLNSILLSCESFMPALKVFNSENKELVYYTNDLTRKLLMEKSEINTLNEINDRKYYVLWIRLSDTPIKKGSTEIIKLRYRDNTIPKSELSRSKMYSIPRFTDSWKMPSGKMHDMFYIVTVPDDNQVDYKVEKILTLEQGNGALSNRFRTLSKDDGFHQNEYKHTISIRIPPVKEEVNFKISYFVKPNPHETNFFIAAILSLIALSIIFAITAIITVDFGHSIIAAVKSHVNTLFGGIITVSIAAIGYIRKPIMNVTRWWFLIPIGISVVGYILQQPLSVPIVIK